MKKLFHCNTYLVKQLCSDISPKFALISDLHLEACVSCVLTDQLDSLTQLEDTG